MSRIKALVLCGGEGKRLRPITYYIQKTMIPIGHNEKPLLEYIVRLLKFHSLTDITFLANYKAQQIESYFGDGARFDVRIRHIQDSESLKGTGGSVMNAYLEKAFNEKDTILVYYGDIITNIDLTNLINFHNEKAASATVAVASGFEVRVGVANMAENGKIQGFVEKPKLQKPVSIGILAFEAEAIREAQKLPRKKESVDLMGDIIPRLIDIGKPVYGFESDAFWYDVGSIEAYEKLDEDKIAEETAFMF
ncbi:MAG: nucleotidyltransferase family protein [Candidatus Bathyarchaeota archaeon]|nr:nucleotidyltransferase family protein [Candidatus Bathyarchaeota archaeon]